MSDVYMYADETGDLDMTGSVGASTYFGFGTAVFAGGHGEKIWEGLALRFSLERKGIHLPRGFHAKNDSHSTRDEVFDLVRRQAPRFDTTFLLKRNAFNHVRADGQVRLYKLAWYLHFKEVARQVSRPGDRLFVIVGSLQTNNKRDAIRRALEDVCNQVGGGLWAVQRTLEGRPCPWFGACVEPALRSQFLPWGQA